MTDITENGTIARIEVTRGSLTEYPIAEKVRGGWQNGVTFYPDDEVTKIKGEYAHMEKTGVDKARGLLALAAIRPSLEWPEATGEAKADVLAEAQVHATLALVEQQRIANRIALCSLVAETERAFTQHGVRAHLIGHEASIYEHGHYPEDAPILHADIREGLGL